MIKIKKVVGFLLIFKNMLRNERAQSENCF